jgi:hypothetical protein
MSTTTLPDPPPAFSAPPKPRRDAARAIGAIFTGMIGLVAGLIALAGVAIIVVGAVARDGDGLYSTGTDRLATNAYALTADPFDIDAEAWIPDAVFGKVRLEARSADGGATFIGIARTDDVDRYLSGVAHARVTDPLESDVRYDTARGGKPDRRPGREDFWVASASGEGRQTLDWELRDGRWSVVAMNADASRGVKIDAKASAEVPWVLSLGIVLAAGGGLVFAISLAALVAFLRRPASRR